MKWIRGVSFGLGILAMSAAVQAQVPSTLDGRDIAKPQRNEDPLGFYRANDVIGMVVKANTGDEIGKIQDVVIDSRSDQVQYFLLQPVASARVEGVLIMPMTYVTREIRVNPRVDFITIDMPMDRIVQGPVIRTSELNTFYTSNPLPIFRTVDRFYNVRHQTLRPDFDGRDRDGRDRDDRDRPDRGDRDDRDRPDRGDRDDRDRPDRGDRDDRDRPDRGDRPDRDSADAPRAGERPMPRTNPPVNPADPADPAERPKTQPGKAPKVDPTTPPRVDPEKPGVSPKTEPKTSPKTEPAPEPSTEPAPKPGTRPPVKPETDPTAPQPAPPGGN